MIIRDREASLRGGMCELAIGIIQLIIIFLIFTPAYGTFLFFNIWDSTVMPLFTTHAFFMVILGIHDINRSKDL